MLARIFQAEKSATQSGTAHTDRWMLEYAPEAPRRIDPLMGWVGSADTRRQVRLEFPSREEAIEYAQRHGIPFTLVPTHRRHPNIRPMGYAGNFASNRRVAWTH